MGFDVARVAVLAAVVLSGPAQAAEPAAPDLAAGRALLEAACAACHAVGALGESPNAEAPAFRVIVGRYAPRALEESLAEGIMTGHPEMPEAAFEPEAIEAIVGYLEALAVTTAP